VNPELLRAFARQVDTASASIRTADVGHKATAAADGIPGSTTQWAMRLVGGTAMSERAQNARVSRRVGVRTLAEFC
jgi:hypothetical protein